MLIDGYVERQEIARKRDAWVLCNLLQPHSKDRLRPAMFLGEDATQDAKGGGWKKITEAEYQKIMADKAARKRAV